MTRPASVARIIATTEMTMVRISPSTNGSLGVNSAFQQNCQSKCIADQSARYFWMLRSDWLH